MSVIKDRPAVVSGVLVLAVVIHGAAARHWESVWTIGHALRKAQGVSDLYIGAAGAVAMVGGFAGVVVIFALQQNLKRFMVMRVQGGESLESNWIHPIVLTFAAAGLLLTAAFSELAGSRVAGTWLFELAIVLSIHGAVRLVWLLAHLATTVRREDEKALAARATMEQAFPAITDRHSA